MLGGTPYSVLRTSSLLSTHLSPQDNSRWPKETNHGTSAGEINLRRAWVRAEFRIFRGKDNLPFSAGHRWRRGTLIEIDRAPMQKLKDEENDRTRRASTNQENRRLVQGRCLIAGSIRGVQRRLRAPKMQKRLIKTANRSMRLAVDFFPTEFAGQERGFGLRVGNLVSDIRVGKGGEILEFVSAALRHSLSQALVMVGEEEERSARRPLLAHEQERRGGRTQQQGRGRSIGRQVDLVMQTLAQGSIADLIMV